MKKILLYISKVVFIILLISTLSLILLPHFFPQSVSDKIKKLANQHLKTELNFSEAHFTFFSHFPALTLTLSDFSLKGSAPFQDKNLVSSKEISMGINIASLLKGQVKIDKIYISEAFINVEVNEKGFANYNVYASSDSVKAPNADTINNAAFKIENITIEKTHFIYNDRSLPMMINARGFNYIGNGDLSKSVFDLVTHAEVDSVDFIYNHQSYVLSKKFNADLITKINTNSLTFLFEKNLLKINQLPVEFNGKFAFLKNGYAIDLNMSSNNTELMNLISAMPSELIKKLDRTKLNGTADFKMKLSGNYIASNNTMPSLNVSIGIRNGYVFNQTYPAPVEHLYLNMNMGIPNMNPDSLTLNIDSLYFNIHKDYLSAAIRLNGIHNPRIYGKIDAEANLESWNNILGFKDFEIKGVYAIHLKTDGIYSSKPDKSHPKSGSIITSIPSFQLSSSLKNGYFKLASAKEPLTNIEFDVHAICPDQFYKHTSIELDHLNANLAKNYLKGSLKVRGGKDFFIQSNLTSLFDFNTLQQVYPIDSLNLKGLLSMGITSSGFYNPSKKLFPKTVANLNIKNGYIQTKYYPKPVQNLNLSATVTNTDGTLKTSNIIITPVSFLFEGSPFELRLSLKNLENIKYDIVSKGSVNLGNVSHVFAEKGFDFSGIIKTDFKLSGLQSDVSKGLFEKLTTMGKLEVKNINVRSPYFPLPFLIKKGIFSFKQDKMWFDSFEASYGQSDFKLGGYINNAINYVLGRDSTVKGSFNLQSDQINANQFSSASTTSSTGTNSNGVIIIPGNLDIDITASVKKVIYNNLNLTDAKGQLTISNGKLAIKQTGFTLIDAPILMDASYISISPKKATFSYHITAKDFDIKKAYDQIKLFHDLASAASGVQGIVSLDYNLAGNLDKNMHPVLPSLNGGGILSIKKIKLKGFRLFSSVEKATGRDSLQNGDISKVDIKTSIKNNIINLEPLKLRIAGFRPKMQGQVSLDGKLNLKFRLGLPPLGIFGIPMTITGTEDKPIIKFRRGSNNQPLQETSDTEDEKNP